MIEADQQQPAPTAPVEAPAPKPAEPAVSAPVVEPTPETAPAETAPSSASSPTPPPSAEPSTATDQPSPEASAGSAPADKIGSKPAVQESFIQQLLIRARAAIQFRKKAKLEKIVASAKEKGSIANDDVEKLLRVSDATATRYLAELVKSGRLHAVGRTSQRRYTPVV